MPIGYAHASEDFERFIVDARDTLDLATRSQAFTVVQAVLWVFRRRLHVQQAIAFAQLLPPVLCAIFLQDWNPAEPVAEFDDPAKLGREAQSIRGDHNFAPDDAIARVAAVLRRHVDSAELDALLSSLPTAAAKYWTPPDL